MPRHTSSQQSLRPPGSRSGSMGSFELSAGLGGLLVTVGLPLLSWMFLTRHDWLSVAVSCFMLICLIFVWNLINFRRHLLESNRLLLLETELSGLMFRSIKIANAASSFEEATSDVCAEICKTTHWQLLEKPVTASPGARLSFVIDKNLPYQVHYSPSESELNFQILTSTVVIAAMKFANQVKPEARVISAVRVIFSQLASVYHREHSIAVLEESHANLAHATKMASLGEMAGGIAHEINNPLQILHAYITRIESYLEWNEPKKKSKKLAAVCLLRLNGSVTSSKACGFLQEMEKAIHWFLILLKKSLMKQRPSQPTKFARLEFALKESMKQKI